ncbi:MAG: hypothetical protein KAT65_11665 [Methanophagales archaeon]|nr:hypothetical protein [Methanophagales archaeon]
MIKYIEKWGTGTITDRQARMDLSQLVSLGLISKIGKARLTKYKLNPKISGNIRKLSEKLLKLNPTYKGGKRGQKVVRWMIYELNEDVRKWLEKAVMLFDGFLEGFGEREE